MEKFLSAFFIVLLGFQPIAWAQGATIGGAGGALQGVGISRATGGSGWTGALLGGIAETVAGAIVGNVQDQREGSYQTAQASSSYQRGYTGPEETTTGGFKPGEYRNCVEQSKKCIKDRQVWGRSSLSFNSDNTGLSGAVYQGEFDGKGEFTWRQEGSKILITYSDKETSVMNVLQGGVIESDGFYFIHESLAKD